MVFVLAGATLVLLLLLGAALSSTQALRRSVRALQTRAETFPVEPRR